MVLVSRAPYTTEKPSPTPNLQYIITRTLASRTATNLWRVQTGMLGLVRRRKVLRKQRRIPVSNT